MGDGLQNKLGGLTLHILMSSELDAVPVSMRAVLISSATSK